MSVLALFRIIIVDGRVQEYGKVRARQFTIADIMPTRRGSRENYASDRRCIIGKPFVAVVAPVLLNLYFYPAHDLNFRDRLFAIYFVRFIRFLSIYPFTFFSDIISLYPQKYKSAFGCSKYDSRSFNSVRLLREIEMRIDFLSRFREFTASLLANYIATCVECNV